MAGILTFKEKDMMFSVFIVGKIRMSLKQSLQCPTNAYFSGFFTFRDFTEIYVFLLFFVPIGTKLVQDWYKDYCFINLLLSALYLQYCLL